jgi:DNA/RNA endonuclease YhcR with UshA esterase domain
MRPPTRLTWLVFALLSPVAAQDAPRPIDPAEAARWVDQVVSVEMTVKSARVVKDVCFLNSEADFKDPKNLTLFLGSEAIAALRQAGVKSPATHYRDKTVRIQGRVTLYRDRPQIVVDDPKQLRLLRPKS